nr:hypothetical protein [Tanacetum cinerariifolium]
MSDSDESGVTYTHISSLFEELSDIGSPGADDHEHLMLPEMLEDPYIEDQPYVEHASPIAQSPEYVPGSDFEAHPEDDDDEDPEEDPVDYPADGGDDVVAPIATDQAPSVEETEPFETDESTATPPPHPAYRTTARISIPALVPMPAWTDSETEARMSREAWVRAINVSDLVYGEVMSLRTTVLGQMLEIRGLQAANRRRQIVILELLRIDHRRSTEISELRTALQGQ